MHPRDFAAERPLFRPEDYFAGRGRATGILQYRSGHPRRSFVLDLEGRFDGRVLTIDEVFRFGTGPDLRRSWQIAKIDDHRYEARGDNVVGVGRGEAYGNVFRMRYDIAIEVGGRSRVVAFDDWLYLQPNHTVINLATIRKFGLKVGGLTAFFHKA